MKKTTTIAQNKDENLFQKIKESLELACQLVLASPIKLPKKVLVIARYVSLAIKLLDSVEQDRNGKPLRSKEGIGHAH